MKLIAHRGNTKGRSDKENKPSYVQKAIDKGYDAEIDLWYINCSIYLGHSTPQYKTDLQFLIKNLDKLWIHCKNIEALQFLNKSTMNYFWHERDSYTLTSHRYIWTYPNQPIVPNSVLVCLDQPYRHDLECYGVCTDTI